MPDLPSDTDARNDMATPRWVKVFGIIAFIIVLLFAVLELTRGPGGHGPARHLPSSEVRVGPAPVGVATEEYAPSAGEVGLGSRRGGRE